MFRFGVVLVTRPTGRIIFLSHFCFVVGYLFSCVVSLPGNQMFVWLGIFCMKGKITKRKTKYIVDKSVEWGGNLPTRQLPFVWMPIWCRPISCFVGIGPNTGYSAGSKFWLVPGPKVQQKKYHQPSFKTYKNTFS